MGFTRRRITLAALALCVLVITLVALNLDSSSEPARALVVTHPGDHDLSSGFPAETLPHASDLQSARIPSENGARSGTRIGASGKGAVIGLVLAGGEPMREAAVIVYTPGQKMVSHAFLEKANFLAGRAYNGLGTWGSFEDITGWDRKEANGETEGGPQVDVGFLFPEARQLTSGKGAFRIEAKPGAYVLEVITQPQGKRCRCVPIEIEAGETLDLGTLRLKSGEAPAQVDPFKRVRDEQRARDDYGVLVLHTGQPGLRTRIQAEGEGGSANYHRMFGEKGINLKWKEPRPVRIELLDKHDFVVGSTDSYQAYPTQGTTELFIPSVPGSLFIHLPRGLQAGAGETYQIHLIRTDSPQLDLRVKSIASKRIPLAEQGFTTSPTGLQYNALRTGAYEVKAIRQTVPAGASAPVNTGEWLRTTAHVFAGQETHCTLE